MLYRNQVIRLASDSGYGGLKGDLFLYVAIPFAGEQRRPVCFRRTRHPELLHRFPAVRLARLHFRINMNGIVSLPVILPIKKFHLPIIGVDLGGSIRNLE